MPWEIPSQFGPVGSLLSIWCYKIVSYFDLHKQGTGNWIHTNLVDYCKVRCSACCLLSILKYESAWSLWLFPPESFGGLWYNCCLEASYFSHEIPPFILTIVIMRLCRCLWKEVYVTEADLLYECISSSSMLHNESRIGNLNIWGSEKSTMCH